MVACLLDAGGLDPTVVNGGIINAYGTNAKVGEGDWIVVEADESDGSFLRLKSTVAVVTNIDPEHLDHYGTFDAAKKAFRDFVENVPFYGFAVVCLDHPEVQALAATVENRRLITYGANPQAEVRALNVKMGPDGARFDVAFAIRGQDETLVKDLHLPMAGMHNVLNSLAALAVARELGVSDKELKKGLASFGGVKRRFTTTGVSHGIRVIDDYGHHPVEIASVLTAARAVSAGKVIAVVQPHRFTRLRDLFADFCACFNDADGDGRLEPHQFGQHLGPAHQRDSLLAGGDHLRIVLLDRRGIDHRGDVRAHVGGVMADEDLRPQLLQPLGIGRALGVGALHDIADAQHDLGDAAHADAADADEMDRADVERDGTQLHAEGLADLPGGGKTGAHPMAAMGGCGHLSRRPLPLAGGGDREAVERARRFTVVEDQCPLCQLR